MKNIAMIAIAGLAAGASAQGVTLTFSADASEVTVGDTITWTVAASFTMAVSSAANSRDASSPYCRSGCHLT